MTPFRQIFLDNGSALRELWAGMNPPNDENGRGGSGTTSRPRWPTIIGFNVPGHDTRHESAAGSHSCVFHAPSFVCGGFVLSDDDPAADLGPFSLSKDGPGPTTCPAPRRWQQQQQLSSLTARFIPGKSIQCFPQGNNDPPAYNDVTGFRPISAVAHDGSSDPASAGGPFHPQKMQSRSSDAPGPSLSDLGKGVPLSSVPASWPLYIVDLDMPVGDRVIVEADRGKHLGIVINDSITLNGVAYGDGGQQGSEKEINPKMIYGRAQPRDNQQLLAKAQNELRALQFCQNKVRQKKLPMEVIDAEYEWFVVHESPGPNLLTRDEIQGSTKLTFYFIAEKRIDFREPVRDLFRGPSTRRWYGIMPGGVVVDFSFCGDCA
ncbi:hypothetical protein EDD15DRAFT_2383845 [Pisolithus albus]|nr:hypothetical protein EDD15DRAFT_2383845 [Pisolithus albus]